MTEFSTATSTAPSPVSDSVVSSTLPTPRGTSASNLFTFRKFLNVKRLSTVPLGVGKAANHKSDEPDKAVRTAVLGQ